MTPSPPRLRIAAILGAAAVFATFGVFPYLLALQRDALASAGRARRRDRRSSAPIACCTF
jgi:hypothetical protein